MRTIRRPWGILMGAVVTALIGSAAAAAPQASAKKATVEIPRLIAKEPDIGRTRRIELEARLATRRADLEQVKKQLEQVKSDAALPAEKKAAELAELEQKSVSISHAIEKDKVRLSKEKRAYSKLRSEAQKDLKKRWGDNLSKPDFVAELTKHARRMALLERIHYVGVIGHEYELVGRAAIAIAAEEYRYRKVLNLVKKGGAVPTSGATESTGSNAESLPAAKSSAAPQTTQATATKPDATKAGNANAKNKTQPPKSAPTTNAVKGANP